MAVEVAGRAVLPDDGDPSDVLLDEAAKLRLFLADCSPGSLMLGDEDARDLPHPRMTRCLNSGETAKTNSW